MIVNGGQPVNFNYATFDYATGLNVAGLIFDVTLGTPILVSGPTAMTEKTTGIYEGIFTPVASKSYLIVAVVYTTSGLTIVDVSRGPSTDIFDAFTSDTTKMNIAYAAFDQLSSLTVNYTCYNLTDSTSTTGTLTYLAFGVYFTQLTGVIGKNYLIVLKPTDATRAPSTSSKQCFSLSSLAPTSTDPGQGNVKAGVIYNINGTELEGTLFSIDPGAANVKTGISYTINNLPITGQLKALQALPVPYDPPMSNTEINSLLPNIDAVLAIRDSIGINKQPVYFLTRVWWTDDTYTTQSDQIGDGVPKDTLSRMVPSPRIVDLSQSLNLREGGVVKQGDIILRDVSKNTYSESQLDGSSQALNVEKLFLVGVKVYQVISLTEGYVTWKIQLRELTNQTRY